MRWWEDLCLRCGRCCYEKLRTARGIVVQHHLPCRFLDTESRVCRVYERRFQRCPECRKMTLYHALFSSYIPDTCGYARRFRIWRKFARSRPGG